MTSLVPGLPTAGHRPAKCPICLKTLDWRLILKHIEEHKRDHRNLKELAQFDKAGYKGAANWRKQTKGKHQPIRK